MRFWLCIATFEIAIQQCNRSNHDKFQGRSWAECGNCKNITYLTLVVRAPTRPGLLEPPTARQVPSRASRPPCPPRRSRSPHGLSAASCLPTMQEHRRCRLAIVRVANGSRVYGCRGGWVSSWGKRCPGPYLALSLHTRRKRIGGQNRRPGRLAPRAAPWRQAQTVWRRQGIAKPWLRLTPSSM